MRVYVVQMLANGLKTHDALSLNSVMRISVTSLQPEGITEKASPFPTCIVWSGGGWVCKKEQLILLGAS